MFVDAEDMCSPVHADNYKIIGNEVINKGTPGEFGIALAAVGSDTTHAFIRNAVVKSNTITNFGQGIASLIDIGGVVDGVFAPNRVN